MKIKLVYAIIFVCSFYIGMSFFKHKDEESENMTKILVNVSSLNFDTVAIHSTQMRKVPFKNVGENTLIVNHIQTTCDCIEVGYNAKLVYPGMSDTLYIRANTAHSGPIQGRVLVYCNVPQSPLRLRTIGYISGIDVENEDNAPLELREKNDAK